MGADDWREGLNLMERILVSGPLEGRRAPARSREAVRGFCTHPTHPTEECVCLIYDTDPSRGWRPIPGGRQPDYLVLFANKGSVILTVVELKGGASGRAEDGIQQIEDLSLKLQDWVNEWRPRRMKVTVQGLLLAPPGAVNPTTQKKLRTARAPIGVLEVPTFPPDLWAAVSRPLNKGAVVEHAQWPRGSEVPLSQLEHILASKAQKLTHQGLRDALPGAPAGLRLQFDLSHSQGFQRGSLAALGLHPDQGVRLALSRVDAGALEKLKTHLQALNWRPPCLTLSVV